MKNKNYYYFNNSKIIIKMDIKIDVNENNSNDEYDFYSNKDDLEIGIFRRKISNLDNNNNNTNEGIKIKIKRS